MPPTTRKAIIAQLKPPRTKAIPEVIIVGADININHINQFLIINLFLLNNLYNYLQKHLCCNPVFHFRTDTFQKIVPHTVSLFDSLLSGNGKHKNLLKQLSTKPKDVFALLPYKNIPTINRISQAL